MRDAEGKFNARRAWRRAGRAAASGVAVRGGTEREDPRLPSLFCSVCTDGKIMLWDAKDYGFNPLGSFSTPEGGVCCAALRSTQTIILGYEHLSLIHI